MKDKSYEKLGSGIEKKTTQNKVCHGKLHTIAATAGAHESEAPPNLELPLATTLLWNKHNFHKQTHN